MRHTLVRSILVMVALAGAVAGLGVPQSARAAETYADVWVELGSSTPAVGCVVDVSVEVRSGGVVPDAEVVAALVVDGWIASLDRGITDANGIAYLLLDTSPAYVGADAWIDVTVNGAWVGGDPSP